MGLDLGLAARRVLITGGAGGIGSAVAEVFVREGAHVAVNYVGDASAALALASRLRGAAGHVIAIEADVRDENAVTHMFDIAENRQGKLDILVNNAGIDGPRAHGWDSDASDWRKVIDVNLTGAFLCAREALKRMVGAGKGVIINTTSVHEVIAWSGRAAYTASKAGLSMMAKTLAQEAAPFGVRVLCVAPGAIQTPINQDVWGRPQSLADLISKIPLGRLGYPEEVARMVAVLSSDVASYVTGTTVFIDGGMTDYPAFAHGG